MPGYVDHLTKPQIYQMERIESLISKLKQQFEQGTDPAVMLGTVQLLEFELSRMRSAVRQSLGTSKVAVVLPISQPATQSLGQAVGAEFEKYAPKPVDPAPVAKEPETHTVKETLLVPFSSSLNICAPPAPQHNPLLRQRFISTSSASRASSTFLGAS